MDRSLQLMVSLNNESIFSYIDVLFHFHNLFNILVVDCKERILGKRKHGRSSSCEPTTKKSKQNAYYVPELAHIVSLCDEKLPFSLLTHEVVENNSRLIKSKCYVLND